MQNITISLCGSNLWGSVRGPGKRSGRIFTSMHAHMQAQTHTCTHTCTQDKSKLSGILPVFSPMGSKSIDPCTPLQWINLPAYQNTIKRLRSESSKGPKHYWFWRSQGKKIVSARHLLDIGILSKCKVGSFRRRMTWPNNAVTESWTTYILLTTSSCGGHF